MRIIVHFLLIIISLNNDLKIDAYVRFVHAPRHFTFTQIFPFTNWKLENLSFTNTCVNVCLNEKFIAKVFRKLLLEQWTTVCIYVYFWHSHLHWLWAACIRFHVNPLYQHKKFPTQFSSVTLLVLPPLLFCIMRYRRAPFHFLANLTKTWISHFGKCFHRFSHALFCYQIQGDGNSKGNNIVAKDTHSHIDKIAFPFI